MRAVQTTTPNYEQLFQAGMKASAVAVHAQLLRGEVVALRPPATGTIVRLYCERQLAIVQLACCDCCVAAPWCEIEIPSVQAQPDVAS